MDRLNKFTLILIFLLGLPGCGVKGGPLPPLNPAPLGRGKSAFEEATSKKSLKKLNSKSQKNEENPSAELGE